MHKRSGGNLDHPQWVEESKAGVEKTYLRPFKLTKTGEVVQKPQAKTIKGGKLVKLPLVTKNKDPILAQMGMDNQRVLENRKLSNYTDQ